MRSVLLVSPYWRERHRWMMSTVRLSELWQHLGFRVIVVCMGNPHGVERVSETLTIHRRPDLFFGDPWNYGVSVGFCGYVRRLVNREQPDVIVVNKVMFWTSLALISLTLRGHRVVLLSDVLVGHTWWPRYLLPKVAAFVGARTVGRLVLRLAHRIVLFYPQPTEVLRALRISTKTSVIPNGIDPAPYAHVGQHGNRHTLTYVGRVESVKGVDDFLAAAVPLLSEYSDLKIVVVGPHRPNHPLVRAYGAQVEFTGFREDVISEYARSTVFVLASRAEGTSNALMEAMASGCACVASDAGGSPTLMEDGVSGLLFPRGNRDALRDRIRSILDDPALRTRLGSAARERVSIHFSWTHTADSWRRLFDEVTDVYSPETDAA